MLFGDKGTEGQGPKARAAIGEIGEPESQADSHAPGTRVVDSPLPEAGEGSR